VPAHGRLYRLGLGLLAAASLSGAAEDAPDILISRQLAEALAIAPGQVVRLSADRSGRQARPFRVAGFYEPRADPMQITAARHEARLHLPDLLSLAADPADPAALESVSAINVALSDVRQVQAVAQTLAGRLPGLQAEPTAPQPGDENPFVVLQRFHLAISVVTLLASTIFLLALMVMLVEERRETIGVLRLIGLRRRRILMQVFGEGLLIALLGALFGVLLAGASQGLWNRFFQWRYDTALVFVRVTPAIAWRCVLLALPFGMLASLVSSWGLLRRPIVSLARR
jgi:putative ABC transport system permease protein